MNRAEILAELMHLCVDLTDLTVRLMNLTKSLEPPEDTPKAEG